MKSRAEYLSFCKVCTNRKFDNTEGLVCSLTGEWADYNGECEHYVEDETAKIREINARKGCEEIYLSEKTGGLHRFGIKNGGVAGFIILLLGLGWLVGGIIYMQVVFYYSFAVIVSGMIILGKYFYALYQKRKADIGARQHADVIDV